MLNNKLPSFLECRKFIYALKSVFARTISKVCNGYCATRRMIQLANYIATPAAFKLHSYLIKFIDASGEKLLASCIYRNMRKLQSCLQPRWN